MKHIHYLCLLALIAAFLFITPSDMYGKNKPKQFKPGNDNNNDNHDNNDSGNHNNSKHQERRYKYHGEDYSFREYYRFYSVEENVFTYEGVYGMHGDIFIFTDRYGNEFDLYIKPVKRVSRWFKGYPLQEGSAYNIRLNETRMYPGDEDVRVGLSFSFGWGSLLLQNNQYYEMYTAPELVNIRGQLYYKGRH